MVTTMSGDDLMRVHGLATGTLANMQRKGRGILADLPRERGVFTRGDSLLILIYQELEAVFGTTSDRPALMVREIRDRLLSMAAHNTVPPRLRIKSELDGTEVVVEIPGFELLERAQRRAELAMAGAA